MVERSRSRKTVLLIEPDRNLARIMGRALQDRGFVVTAVVTGRESLAVLDTQYPDAVVVDPDLADVAGPLVLERLRRLEQAGGPSPTWVVISALDRMDVAGRYGLSIPHFLAKPFDPWALVRLLEELLKEK